MAGLLRSLAVVTGAVCVAIGIFHFAGGIYSVPGESGAGATVDSRERFYAALSLGYGAAWIWAGTRRPVPASAIRGLAAVLLLGGLGRLLSMVLVGQPHWLQTAQTGVELVVPPLFLWLASADERASIRSRPGQHLGGVR